MQQQRRETISPFLVFATVICTVIGVGIFYKNEGVFGATNNNWKEIIAAWLLVSFICICTSFSYSRISLIHNTNLGFCGWAGSVVNRRFSCFVSQLYILFKLGICVPAFCFYAASSFLKIFQNDEYLLKDGMGKFSSIGLIFLIGIFILIVCMTMNYRSPSGSLMVQRVFLYSKFVPVVMAVIFGIVLSIMRGSGGLFTNRPNDSGSQGFSLKNVIAAAPGIMMSFDAFLNAGFFAKKLRNPRKYIPKIYMGSVIFFVALYLLITVNQILCGQGSAQKIFSADQLGDTGSRITTSIFLLFVFISSVGLVNGYSTTMISVIRQGFDDDFFYVKKYFLKWFGDERRAAFGFWVALSAFWTTLMMIVSLSTGSDAFFDGMTNVPTIFMFSVYGFLAGAYGYQQLKRGLSATLDQREKWDLAAVTITSCISCIGWLGIALYQIIYTCFYLPIFNFHGTFETWKGPWSSGVSIHNWQASLIMFLCLLAAILFYVINEILQRRNRENDKEDRRAWATIIN